MDFLWVSDHILWWRPMHDSLVLLSAVAARTSRIRLGPAVLLLALRNPILAAKSLASIDRLSEGRLTVGVGIGGEYPAEWEALGVERQIRARRTDEMIEALRALWAEGDATFEGRHVTIGPLDLHPKPHRPPPIWIGGRSSFALRRAARAGDGWMGIFTTPERYGEQVGELREQAAAAGRDPEIIHRALYVWTCIADRDSQARSLAQVLLPAFYQVPFEKLERYAIVGSPERCAERFSAFAAAGVQHFAVAPIAPEATVEPLHRLVREVVPHLSG